MNVRGKLAILLVPLCSLLSSGIAQAQTWAITYGGSGHERAASIQQTSDGGYIMAGTTAPFDPGPEDIWVLKLNSDGSVAWQKTYGGAGFEWANSIQQTLDGGYIVVGGTHASGGADYGALYVLKLNGAGAVEWQKTYGSIYYDTDIKTYSIQQTLDGGYIVAGGTYFFGAGCADIWVLKLDTNGTVAWQKAYGGTGCEWAYSIQQTSDGGYIMAGLTYNRVGVGDPDLLVLKLHDDGTVAWQKTYGGTGWDAGFSIQQTSDNGYIVAGTSNSSDATSNGWVLKLDNDGTVAWQKSYGGLDYEGFFSIQQIMDGGYIVAGDWMPFGADRFDFEGDYSNIWVLRLQSDGTVTWQKTYGGVNAEYVASIQQTADGGYIMAGSTLSFGVASDNFNNWVLKLDGNGDIAGATFQNTTSAPVSDTNAIVTSTNMVLSTPTFATGTTSAIVADTNIVPISTIPDINVSSITGKVTSNGSGLGNVTMRLDGTNPDSTVTNPDGTFTISGVTDGTYTITPSLNGYVFSPPSITVTIEGSNVTAQNFAASPVTSISGGFDSRLLPVSPSSKGGQLINDNYDQAQASLVWNPAKFRPEKHTVVIVHGVNEDESDKLPPWAISMGDFLIQSGKANVIFWEWLEDAKGTFITRPDQMIMEDQGNNLAVELNKVIGNYNGKIHFIGHSAGASLAYTAVNSWYKNTGKRIDALTLLDAYMFDNAKCSKNPLLNPLGPISCITSMFSIIPASEAKFLDNYWAVVGALSNWLTFNYPPAIPNAYIYDYNYYSIFYNPNLYKDAIASYPPSYFLDEGLANAAHKPPVNWYMASMVDQLQLAGSSANSSNHKYGFYWSPIFDDHARPRKGSNLALYGFENYFDLYTEKEYNQAVEVQVKQGVDAAADLLIRLTDKTIAAGISLYVEFIDDLKDAQGWITDRADKVVHSRDGWLWAQTGSPVTFSKQYEIPVNANILSYSYEVLSADSNETIEVFVNDQLVFVRLAEADSGKGVICSDLINISQWHGQTVSITFRINSEGGTPLTFRLHDLAFASLDKTAITTVKVTGTAYNYPENSTYRASYSLDITGKTTPTGTLKYYYSRTRMNFVSTGITGVAVSGKIAIMSGTGTVNGFGGYTFTATLTDGAPDGFGIVIRKPDGTTHYSAPSKAVSSGDLVISQ